MGVLMDGVNSLADKIVGAEVKFILKPVTEGLAHLATDGLNALTAAMPDIGFAIVIICGVGIMISGNVPKWLGRFAVGIGGVIVWLLNA